MDFALTDEQRLIQGSVRQFARERIAPIAAEIDRTGEYPRETLALMGELGLMGMAVPERWGGAGMDTVSYVLALEEISAACATHGVIMSVQNSLPEQMILKHGTDEQRERWLIPLARGEMIGAFCLTEPQAGSDAASLRARAERDGDEYVLTGTKSWVSGAGVSDLYMVMVRTSREAGPRGVSAFVVPSGLPGLNFGAPEDKLGLRASHTGIVNLDGVRVPAANRIGPEGQGLIIALGSLDQGRIGIAAQAIGIARAGFEAARDYSSERRQFGQLIREFQGVSFKIAEMSMELDAARLLTWYAAWRKDQGLPFIRHASEAKLFASQAANRITHAAIQVFGANGYSREYPVERHFRDARVTEIYEGTSEIQKVVIARQVYKERVG
jgi:alkylation response protein AidB-like acyl-CoA dehydrogenase